jgi:hypothetical protein
MARHNARLLHIGEGLKEKARMVSHPGENRVRRSFG